MRLLALADVLHLHHRLIAETGGADGIRDLGVIESALAAPQATFTGRDLHPDVLSKAAALGFSLVRGHGFVDGNKRVGVAALELFLSLNGIELHADIDDTEELVTDLAAGTITKDELIRWLRVRTRP